MKKGGLAFLLLFPFAISLLGVVTSTGGFQRIEKDLIDIEWDYAPQVGFKIQGEKVKLIAHGIYDKTCALAYGNDLVWTLQNEDPNDEEVHATLEKSTKVNDEGNFDYYLLALSEGDVTLTVANAKGTLSKSMTGIIYKDFAVTVAPKVSPSQSNIDPSLYYGEFDWGSQGQKRKAEIDYSFSVFPSSSLTESASLELASCSDNLEVDLAGGKVKVKNVVEDVEEASFVLSFKGKKRATSFRLVKNGINVYTYSDLLKCTNQSEDGEIVCLRRSFESLSRYAEKDEKGNPLFEGGQPKQAKDNVALFGNFQGYSSSGSPLYSFASEVYSHPTTMDTSYLDQWNEFASGDPLYADSVLSKEVYAGLRVQKDFYGNGYTISFHNLAYPYGKTTIIQEDGTVASIPTLTKENLFRGPLLTYCLGDPTRFPLIGLYGEDNAGIYVDGDGILINDLVAKNADYGDSFTFLKYCGTVVDLHGDGITLANCQLSSGKNVVRAFSCKDAAIVNCLLSNALNFCLDLGSDSLEPLQAEKKGSYLDLDGAVHNVSYADWMASSKGQDVLNGYLGTLSSVSSGDTESTKKAEKAIESIASSTEREDWKRDYQTTVTLKDSYLYKTGVSCVGFENSFHGPFLYNASPTQIGSLLEMLSIPIDGEGHSLIPFIPKGMALQMKPSLLKVEGKTDFYDDKKVSDIVLEGILQQDFTGIISILPDDLKDKLSTLKKSLGIDAIFPLKEALSELVVSKGFQNEESGTVSMPFSYYGGGINNSALELSRWDNFLPYAGEAKEDLVHYYLYRNSDGQERYWNFLYRIVTMVTGFEDFRFGFYDGSGSHVGLSPNVEDLKKNAQQGGIAP